MRKAPWLKKEDQYANMPIPRRVPLQLVEA